MLGMRPLGGKIESYDAPSTEEIARRTGLDVAEILRFDGNTSPQLLPSTRAEALAEELARIHTYPHGGYPRLEQAIADYAGVSPENVLHGASSMCPVSPRRIRGTWSENSRPSSRIVRGS